MKKNLKKISGGRNFFQGVGRGKENFLRFTKRGGKKRKNGQKIEMGVGKMGVGQTLKWGGKNFQKFFGG